MHPLQVLPSSAPCAKTASREPATRFKRLAVLTPVLLAVVVLLQFSAGAFRSEFGGYPDEASHYISGLLIRDYLASGFPGSPVAFAKNYYLHYPYFALGHWPPVFYVVEGFWMALFSPSRVSVLLLMAVITTVLALSVYIFLRESLGPAVALLMSILVVLVPLVQRYTDMVMLDTLLGLFSFWAVLCFGKFVHSGRWRHALLFSLFAALAILTKGNGFDLVCVPPLTLILTRRYKFFAMPALWIAGLLVAVGALPWHIATRDLMLPTFLYHPGPKFTLAAMAFYARLLVQSVGVGALTLAGIGLWQRLVRGYSSRSIDPVWAAFGAYLLGVVTFHCLVSGGLEARYLVPAIAPLVLFVAAGLGFLSEHLPAAVPAPKYRCAALAVIAILLFTGEAFAVPQKNQYGFSRLADRLASLPGFAESTILVSSETSTGEGMLVAEIAMRGSRPRPTVLRASKVLADSNWNVTTYRPRFESAAALDACLVALPITYLVVDSAPGRESYAHHRQILAVLRAGTEHWRLLSNYAGKGGSVFLYAAAGGRPPVSRRPVAVLDIDWTDAGQKWPVSMRLACPAETPDGKARASHANTLQGTP